MTPTTKLLELARKATPGEWTVLHPHKEYSWITASDAEPGDIVCCAPDGPASLKRWPDTSAFIAAANPSAIIALVEQRDALLGAGKALDTLWTEDVPHGPGTEGDERLFAPETLAVWRQIRAAIALCEPTETVNGAAIFVPCLTLPGVLK